LVLLRISFNGRTNREQSDRGYEAKTVETGRKKNEINKMNTAQEERKVEADAEHGAATSRY
jgi:hypothetical protein